MQKTQENLELHLKNKDKEAFKVVREYIQMLVSDKQTQQYQNMIISAIQNGIRQQTNHIFFLHSLRLAKEAIEQFQPEFIQQFQLQLLADYERIALWRKDDPNRNNRLFSEAPNKEQSQYSSSSIILLLEEINVWAMWFPQDKYGQDTSYYLLFAKLLENGIKFPQFQYFKEDKVKSLTNPNYINPELRKQQLQLKHEEELQKEELQKKKLEEKIWKKNRVQFLNDQYQQTYSQFIGIVDSYTKDQASFNEQLKLTMNQFRELEILIQQDLKKFQDQDQEKIELEENLGSIFQLFEHYSQYDSQQITQNQYRSRYSSKLEPSSQLLKSNSNKGQLQTISEVPSDSSIPSRQILRQDTKKESIMIYQGLQIEDLKKEYEQQILVLKQDLEYQRKQYKENNDQLNIEIQHLKTDNHHKEIKIQDLERQMQQKDTRTQTTVSYTNQNNNDHEMLHLKQLIQQYGSENDDLKYKLEQVNQQNSQLHTDLNHKNMQLDKLDKQIRVISQENENFKQQINQLQKQNLIQKNLEQQLLNSDDDEKFNKYLLKIKFEQQELFGKYQNDIIKEQQIQRKLQDLINQMEAQLQNITQEKDYIVGMMEIYYQLNIQYKQQIEQQIKTIANLQVIDNSKLLNKTNNQKRIMNYRLQTYKM
ncbi:hypothetical protein pb186bvf_017551 [Paramecium bursaria]